MKSERKILSFGSLNLDITYSVPHIVQPGETLSSSGVTHSVGGKGLNQSITLSKAGSQVYHAGAVGKEDGQVLIDTLEAENVDTQYVLKKDILSGNAFIQVDVSGQNSIVLFDGANKALKTNDIDKVLNSFHAGDYIVLQNEINQMEEIVSLASQKGLTIFYNPSPLNEEVFKLDLNKIDWFFLNELEAAQLSHQKAYDEETLMLLLDKYPKANFVITLGEKGSLCYYDGKVYHQAIHEVKAVDTTGAGDTFTGYFISTFERTNDIKLALKYASIASGLAVSKQGAASSIPALSEVEKII